MKIALNTSTMAPFKMPLEEQIMLASMVGFKGIELWVRDIKEYIRQGNTPEKLRDYAAERDIEIVNGIAFSKWCDSDENVRKEAFEEAETDMNLLSSVGCQAIAAPPYGDLSNMTYEGMAEGYKRLCNIGQRYDIQVYLELWGMSPMLSRISQGLYVLAESGVFDGKLLLDSYHLYKGNNDFETLKILDEKHIGIVHINDYPADPPRETITDKYRVFPGDGIAPLHQFIDNLKRTGYYGYLSLEVFIEDYNGKTTLEVAREAYNKVNDLLKSRKPTKRGAK